ncbi:periplasmic heavy metal sensor [bacterium]|nr:periplasmic heavy metal sensor [bacterium]
MKKTLLVVAVAALIATAFSFATARWFASRQAGPAAGPTLHDVAWLQRELQLSATQTRELERFQQEYQARFATLCAAHCDARFVLGNELGRPQPDAARCRDHVAKMNAAQAAAEQATLEHILKVRAVLTDAQAQRYGQLVGDQVCSMPRAGSM